MELHVLVGADERAPDLVFALKELLARTEIPAVILEQDDRLVVRGMTWSTLEQRYVCRVLNRAGYDVAVPL